MTDELLGVMADKLDPALIAPVVGWLVHEECSVTGETFSAVGGRVARFFVGLTQGYFNSDLSVEDVRDNLDQIRSEEGYIVPNSPADEFRQVMKHFKSPTS
jgi:hypothetical protein